MAAVPVSFTGYADRADAVRALEGVRTLFMVSGSESADRRDQHYAFVDAAAEAGVRHVVYTSFFGAAPDATFTLARDHYATEEHIKASGMGWTFLRDNLYLDVIPLFVGEDDVIRGPAGDGVRLRGQPTTTSPPAPRRCCPTPDAHVGRTYDLTGPEALSLSAAAETLSAALGRQITLPRRDDRGGLRVAAAVAGPRLAVRRLGEHLHRDRGRRARAGDRRRPHPDGTPADEPGGLLARKSR